MAGTLTLSGVTIANGRLYNPTGRKLLVWKMENMVKSSAVFSETLPDGFLSNSVADFNRDGIEDFLLFNISIRKTQFRFWDGKAFLGSSKAGPLLPVGYVPLGCGDLNKDTNPDIVIYNPQEKKLMVWLMNGTSLLSRVNLPNPEAGFVPVAVDDYNSNGNADLLFYKQVTRSTRIFFMNRTSLGTSANGPTIPSG